MQRKVVVVSLVLLGLSASVFGQIRVIGESGCGVGGEAEVWQRYGELKDRAHIWFKFPPPSCFESATAQWVENGATHGVMTVSGATLLTSSEDTIGGITSGGWTYWHNRASRYRGGAQGIKSVWFVVDEPVRARVQLGASAGSDVGGILCNVGARAEVSLSGDRWTLRTYSTYRPWEEESSPPVDEEVLLCPDEVYALESQGQAWIDEGDVCRTSEDWPRGNGIATYHVSVIKTLASCR